MTTAIRTAESGEVRTRAIVATLEAEWALASGRVRPAAMPAAPAARSGQIASPVACPARTHHRARFRRSSRCRPVSPCGHAFETGRPTTPVQARAHLTRRGRLSITLSSAAVLVGLAALAYVSLGSATMAGGASIAGDVAPASVGAAASARAAGDTAVVSGSADNATRGIVVVRPGQTLWQIARTVRTSGDPAATVQQIRSLNHLTSSTLHAGERLRLPA